MLKDRLIFLGQNSSKGEMKLMDIISLRPVGVVNSCVSNRDLMPTSGQVAYITILPEYVKALERIEEYSHLWVLSWLHQAKREVLTAVPVKINPHVAPFGIFALRSPSRPNPVALSLVRLLKREKDNRLLVAGMDVIDGTPVLDIKPYFERDTVFSPVAPHIPCSREGVLLRALFTQALNQHGEECDDLRLAVRMGMLVEEKFGYLKDPELKVSVSGPPCFADCIQGLTRARLANPPRFAYRHDESKYEVIWERGQERLTLTADRGLNEEEFTQAKDEEIFISKLSQ